MDDGRVMRDRMQSARMALDRAGGGAPDGSAAMLAQTTTVATYPTTAQSFYACLSADIDGSESEGAAATYVQSNPAVFYAWNAGTQVPPVGTPVVCHAVGGRWVFRYDAAPSN